MKKEFVHSFSQGKVASIVLDTPSANVITLESFRRIQEKLDELENDASEALVISGANGNFSAGMNLAWMYGLQHSPEEARAVVDEMYKIGLRIAEFPKPTIAAIPNGFCAGIGLELALLCDWIVASEKNAATIKLKAGAAEHGFMLGLGASYQLFWKMGFRNTVNFLFGAQAIDLILAQRLYLVDHILPGDDFSEASHQFANELLEGKWPAKTGFIVKNDKPSLPEVENFENKFGLDVVTLTLLVLDVCRNAGTIAEAMRIEKSYFMNLFLSENSKEKVGEFLKSVKQKKTKNLH